MRKNQQERLDQRAAALSASRSRENHVVIIPAGMQIARTFTLTACAGRGARITQLGAQFKTRRVSLKISIEIQEHPSAASKKKEKKGRKKAAGLLIRQQARKPAYSHQISL
jgi:hypothetical protein